MNPCLQAVTAAAVCLAADAFAQDAARGAALYRALPGNPGVGSCISCHGEPVNNRNSVLRGAAGASVILRTIGAVGAMGYLRQYLSEADLADISAYLATIVPAGPIESLPDLWPTADAFGAQQVGTTSMPREILVRNRRSTGDQSIGAVVASDPLQWPLEHDCPIALPPLGQCRIRVAFRPSGVGSATGGFVVYDRSGLALRSGTLSGLGLADVPPSLDWEATPDFAFGRVELGTPALRTAVLINRSPTLAVNLERLRITGPGASRFRLEADCLASRRIEPGGRCRLELGFVAQAPGLSEGWIEIEADATNAPLARASATAVSSAAEPAAPPAEAPPAGGAVREVWLALLAAAVFGLRRRAPARGLRFPRVRRRSW